VIVEVIVVVVVVVVVMMVVVGRNDRNEELFETIKKKTRQGFGLKPHEVAGEDPGSVFMVAYKPSKANNGTSV